MNVKTLCLAILQHGDATGYEIKKMSVEGEYSYFVDASFGSIYPALARLEADGSVTVREETHPGKPARKVYSITEEGRATLVAELSGPTDPDIFRSPFLLVAMNAELLSRDQVAAAIDARIGQLERDTQLAEVEQASRDGNDAVAQIIQSASREATLSRGMFDDGFKERIALRLERVEAAMSRQIARGTGVLATIGATAPFVGLFGTVWGIMNAFIGISEAHTTNLAVVAPGIAEALLATALGLVAAIPAVVIYNHLTRSIAGYRALLGDASVMVMLLVSREGDRSLFRLARAAE